MRHVQLIFGVLLALGVLLTCTFAPITPDAQSTTPVVQVTRSTEESPAAESAPETSSTERVATRRTQRPQVHRLGDQRSYTVDMDSHLVRAGADGQVGWELDGTLQMTLVGHDDDLAIYHLTLDVEAVTWRKETGELFPVPDAEQRGLARPFYATIEPNGRLAALHFQPEVTAATRGSLKSIVSATQHVRPAGSPTHWQTEESNAQGDYLATYEKVANRTFEKTRYAYLRVSAVGGVVSGQELGLEIERSLGRQVFAQDGWLQQASDDETIRVQTLGSDAALRIRSRCTLQQSAQGTATALVGTQDGQWPQLDTVSMAAAEVEARTSDERSILKEMRAGATLQSIETELRAMARAEDPFEVGVNIMHKTSALLELEPERAREIPALIASLEDPEASALLIGSLESAGNPESQAALVEVAQEAAEFVTRQRAVVAMGGVEEPTEATLDALMAEADEDDDANTGILALGSAAGHAEENQTRRDAIEELLARYEEAPTSLEKATVMHALGNAGDPRIMPAVQDGLSSQDTVLVAASVASLRFLPGDEVDAVITQLLLEHTETEVRLAAAGTTFYRGPVAISMVAAAMPHESDLVIRKALVRTLAHLKTMPEATTLLESVAGQDPSDELRELAQAILTPVGGGDDETSQEG